VPLDLEAIQAALKEAGLDGWLFCDLHHRDPMAYRILGLPASGMTTRRWFYWVPAEGVPVKLCHRVEPRKLEALPGRQDHFLSWQELHEKLRAALGPPRRLAMQYSPLNHIPYVSVVDAGTVELVRSFGHEVQSSADLVQRFEAVYGAEGWESHCFAGERVQGIKDECFALMDGALRRGKHLTEHDVKEFILARFRDEGLSSDGDSPIVAFDDHAADPHFEPAREGSYDLRPGRAILVDLWARRADPPGVYYDITWCGFAGAEPPARLAEIFAVARRARDRAVGFLEEAAREGRSVRGFEVDEVSRRVVREAGYGPAFLHRTGHSIGTSVHGNGANLDNLETRDERKLLPGTLFSIEPGIYLEGEMGVRTEINVFLAPDGRPRIYGAIQNDLVLVGA
jgi:Xaa-Pro aminopeptidase